MKIIDPMYEAWLIAAKSEWEHGLFKSRRAAAHAYNVSWMWFYCQSSNPDAFRSLWQHYVLGSMGKMAREEPTSPNSCSPRHRRQSCAIGSNSMP